MIPLLAALMAMQSLGSCRAMDTNLSPPYAGWSVVAEGVATDHATVLPVDHPERSYLGRRGGPVTFELRVDEAGEYGIAVDQAGFIQVRAFSNVPNAGMPAPLRPTHQGRGPYCSTIRSITWFNLARYDSSGRHIQGRYFVTLFGLRQRNVRVMLVAPFGSDNRGPRR